MLKSNEKYITVLASDNSIQMNVCITKFVDICVVVKYKEIDIQKFVPCGVRIFFNGIPIIYDYIFRDKDGKFLEFDYEKLVYALRKSLHLILNEKFWEETFWTIGDGEKQLPFLTTMKETTNFSIKNNSESNCTENEVIVLYLDSLVWFAYDMCFVGNEELKPNIVQIINDLNEERS